MKAAVGRLLLVGFVALLLAPACAVSGLSFVTDDRVKILQPKENGEVTLPFTLDWTAKDFDGDFVIFFDRSPMRPGQTLRALVPEGDPCRTEPGCPDAAWLADHFMYIYVTGDTSLVVDRLPDRRVNDRDKDRHDVTIVLLDDAGRRVGESAFTTEFIVKRED